MSLPNQNNGSTASSGLNIVLESLLQVVIVEVNWPFCKGQEWDLESGTPLMSPESRNTAGHVLSRMENPQPLSSSTHSFLLIRLLELLHCISGQHEHEHEHEIRDKRGPRD